MRFSQYLDQNSTPEWRRAYIDYRACTRQIRIIAARITGKPVPEGDEDLSNGDDDYDFGPARPPKTTLQVNPTTSGLRRRTVSAASSAPRLSLPPSLPSLRWFGPGSSTDYLASPTEDELNNSVEHIPPSSQSPPDTALQPNDPPKPPTSAPKARSVSLKSVTGTTEASPMSPRRAARVYKRQSLRSIGSGSGLEEMREEDEHDASFMAQGSIRARRPSYGVPQDVDDLFSPSAQQRPEPALPEMTPPHLACVLPPPPEARKIRAQYPRSPTVQKQLGKQLSTLSPIRSDRPLPPTPRNRSLPPTPGPPPTKPLPRTPHSLASSHPNQSGTSTPTMEGAAIHPVPSGENPQSLEQLYDCLEPDEYAFFNIVDRELDKVEKFFSSREANCNLKLVQLKEQLEMLQGHKESVDRRYAHWENKIDTFVAATARMLGIEHTPGQHSVDEHGRVVPKSSETGTGETVGEKRIQGGKSLGVTNQSLVYEPEEDDDDSWFHIDKYLENQRSIQKALNEFYHLLELLKNYRVLNLMGFRKALGKFEKVTKIACLELYSQERIASSTLSEAKPINDLLKETEELYARHFSEGNIQEARRCLRVGVRIDTYYESTYRGAFLCGLGLPAAVMGIVKYFDPELRRTVPGYDTLMVIYSALYLPVIFALLFQFNLDGWVKMRINYEFVLELTRPCLDHRCFHEIPAFLFMTLSYCFFFSFYPVAPHSIAPTTWPSAWLVFIAVFFINPLPIFRRNSRWWFLRAMGHVITPGVTSVKFVVFFIADILNSHTYTIQNIYLLGCLASKDWPADGFQRCKSNDWAFAVLGSLAPLIRLIQCLKRWWDTRVPVHLVNATKYAISIITTCLQVWNRSRGFTHDATSLALWIVFASINSMFTVSWDIVVDWSLLRPGYKCLRPDLGYPSKWMYYGAMVYNVLIRFVWVWVLPKAGTYPRLRSWIFALLEIVRRFIWNFFRVETEHLGNADCFRITADIPLPYDKLAAADNSFAVTSARDAHRGALRNRMAKIGNKLVGTEAGRGPDALNVGARGRASTREYEARRPGDDPMVPIMADFGGDVV